MRVMDGDTPRLYATTLVYQDFLPAVDSPVGESSGTPADAVFPTRVEMGRQIPTGSEAVQVAPEVLTPAHASAATEVLTPAHAPASTEGSAPVLTHDASTESSAPVPTHDATKFLASAPSHAETAVSVHEPTHAVAPDMSTARRRILGKTSVPSGSMHSLSGHDPSCSVRAPMAFFLEVWPSSCREGVRVSPLTGPALQLSERDNVQLRAYLMVKGGYYQQATKHAASILCDWLRVQGCRDVTLDPVPTAEPEQSGVQQLVRAMFAAVGIADLQPPVRVLMGSTPAESVDCTSGKFPGISFVLLPVRLPRSGGEVWCPLQRGDTIQGELGMCHVQGARSVPCSARFLVSTARRPCRALPGGPMHGGCGQGWFCAVRAGGVASYSVVAPWPVVMEFLPVELFVEPCYRDAPWPSESFESCRERASGPNPLGTGASDATSGWIGNELPPGRRKSALVQHDSFTLCGADRSFAVPS